MALASKKPTISFEYFPPKSDKAAEALWSAVPALAAFDPKFMTVTYGAGGSTHDGTVETLKRISGDTSIPMAAHLPFIGSTMGELKALTDELWAMGVKHIIALRGICPTTCNGRWMMMRTTSNIHPTSWRR